MTYIEVVILSLVEGLTEYLPISSTGHLIITSALMGIEEQGFVKNFNIIIQFGAILAVLLIYWKRFMPNLSFYKKIIISFLPAAIIGFVIKNKIDALLGSVTVVAYALIIGGIILILSDRLFLAKTISSGSNKKTIDDLTIADCTKIGFVQCFAFIPGVSRSAATILGGLAFGMDRKEAAEFSFFLAVPTLTAAAFYKTYKTFHEVASIDSNQVAMLAAGVILSFIFAVLAIRFFISIVGRYGFKYFGYYRILLGLLILLFM